MIFKRFFQRTFFAGLFSCWAFIAEAQDTTSIRLMVLKEVDSSRAKAGDIVKLRVDEPFLFHGETVRIGTLAYGKVDLAQDGGMALRRGKLKVSLDYLDLGGTHIPLDGELVDNGEGGQFDDASKAVLAPIYLLFARGNVAKLRAGEIVYGRLSMTHQETVTIKGADSPSISTATSPEQ